MMVNDSDPLQKLLDQSAKALDAGDLATARAGYQRILKTEESAGAHFGLAKIAELLETHDLAIDEYTYGLNLTADDPAGYLGRGNANFARGNFESAVADFAHFIKLVPNSPLGYRRSGDVYRVMGRSNCEQSLEMYRQSLERNGEDAGAHYGMALVLETLEKYSLATEHYSRVIELIPKEPAGYFGRGNAHFAAGNLKAALADFAQVIKLAPDDSRGYRRSGDVYRVMGTPNFEQSLEMYRQGLEQDANDADVHYGMAQVCEALEKYPLAAEHYSRVIELVPENPVGYNGRGDAHFAAGNLKAALADFAQVIKLAPNDSRGYRRSGDVYRVMGTPNFEQSLKMYGQGLERDADDVDAHYGLALVYERLKKYPEAIEHYSRVIELVPDIAVGYEGRGDAYLEINELKAALEDYAQVIKLAPDSSGGYRRTGDVYRMMGRSTFEQSLAMYRQGLERGADDVDAHYGIALVFEALEKNQEAIDHYSRVIELAPDLPLGYVSRGQIYLAARKNERALLDFDEAVKVDPTSVEGFLGRGQVFEAQEFYNEAIVEYECAIKADSSD
jgi:tetratricopeptide (TPR) repeat protein